MGTQPREHQVDIRQAAAAFERHRAHLTGVAYRMLGTLADAEDAVQETYLRFARTDVSGLRDVRAWLTTTVAGILGSARSFRQWAADHATAFMKDPAP